MLAKDLIKILEAFPEAEVVGTTVKYFERSHYSAGWERTDMYTYDSVKATDKYLIINFGAEGTI